MTSTLFRFRFGVADWLMCCIMLVLLGLPSLGITGVTARAFLETEGQAEHEELGERDLCCSQRRIQLRRSLDYIPFVVISAATMAQSTPKTFGWTAYIGHRISKELLAPLRC